MRYFSADKIKELFDFEEMVQTMKSGFVEYAQMSNTMGQRFIVDIGNGNSTSIIGPGVLPSIPAYSIKVNSKFPRGNPAIKGIVALFDRQSGAILAQFDSGEITAIRTGLSAALASHALCNDTDRLAIIGVGKQNILQLEYLIKLRKINHVTVYDTNIQKVREFDAIFKDRMQVTCKSSLNEVVQNQDLILVATWSRIPLLNLEHTNKKTHITTLGADEPGKVEVSKSLVLNSKLIVDDTLLNMKMGTPGNLECSPSTIFKNIGEVYLDSTLKNQLSIERTIYSPVGLAFQDLILCWNLYKKSI